MMTTTMMTMTMTTMTMMTMTMRTKNHVSVQFVSDLLERPHQLVSGRFVERKAMIDWQVSFNG